MRNLRLRVNGTKEDQWRQNGKWRPTASTPSAAPAQRLPTAKPWRNRVTHGLTSYSGLLPGEKLDDFSDLRARVFAELAPDSAIEMELTDRIAGLLWRLRRVPAFEAALLAWTHACKEEASPFTAGEPPLTRRFTKDGRPIPASQTKLLAVGRSLDGFLKGGLGARLSRYETALQRALSASMLDLRRMQARRKAQGARDVCMGAAPAEGGGVTPRLAFTAQEPE